MMRHIGLTLMTLILAGCAGTAADYASVSTQINKELDQAVAQTQRPPVQSEAVAKALLPPLKIEMPVGAGSPVEPRFDLVVNNAPAREVFMGIVSGSRHSMLVHPEVTGAISVNLKDVTILEALDALRDLYGYEYRVDGNRIFIQPISMQTRVFKVNYLTGLRKGASDIRVLSGSVGDVSLPGSTSGTGTGTGTGTGSTPSTPGGGSRTVESGRISTTSTSDFWGDLSSALKAIVGTESGRNVIVSPQSGVIVVRAMPAELRNVAEFLKASQLSVERQVVLEAKIIEVRLTEAFQSGINWSAFKTGPNSRVSLGQLMPGAVLSPNGVLGGTDVPVAGLPGTNLANVGTAAAVGTMFGMAFQTSSFAALLSFLESQGTVHVLSSPRIATLNNQKAILKVGTDEFFVTNVSSTTTTGTATTTTPSVTLQPFFSGIMLDVTPQVDENAHIILHIHPSVSQVSQSPQRIDLGLGGILNLPLAKSSISETDSIVRAQDGQIVAIGGLMTQSMADDHAQVPGLGNIPGVGAAFRQNNKSMQKRELVILLKATVVQDNDVWSQNILESQQRIREMGRDGGGR